MDKVDKINFFKGVGETSKDTVKLASTAIISVAAAAITLGVVGSLFGGNKS